MAENRKRKGKKIISVCALLVSGSFCKILVVLFIMALAEAISFSLVLYKGGQEEMLETLLDRSLPAIAFLLAFGAVFCILILTEGRMNRCGRYTLMRLQITKKQLFLLETGYHVLCLVMLFAVQVYMILWMAWMYGKISGQLDASGQILFLAFYRNRFLHCLLPLAETGKWVRNILMILAFGMEAGIREKSRAAGQAGLFVLTASWFVSPVGVGYRDVVSCMMYAVVIVVDLLSSVLFQEKRENPAYDS